MKTALAIFLASLAMYIWGSIWWMTIGMSPVKYMEDDTAVAAAMTAAMPEPGVYFLPDFADYANDSEGFNAKHEAGPLAQIFFHPTGRSAMDPSVMIFGFLHMVASVTVVALLLTLVKGSLPTYASRLIFVVGLGLFAAIFNRLGDMIWFFHHLDWTLFNIIFGLISWLVAGAVLAAMIKTKPAPSA